MRAQSLAIDRFCAKGPQVPGGEARSAAAVWAWAHRQNEVRLSITVVICV